MATKVSSEMLQHLPNVANFVSRKTSDKLLEIEVNVKDFNVFAGGGVLDDTTTIQKAIDYVASIGGGWVCFTQGVYLAKNIRMKSNVWFKGKGGIVKTLGTAIAEERLFYTAENVNRVKFRDMILDGNKGVVPGDMFSGVPLVELAFGKTVSRVEIIDCEFRNNGYVGFRSIATSNRIKITGCEFYDVDACCWFGLAPASNVRIYGNNFEEGLSEGVTIDLGTGFSYRNFSISNNTCKNKVSCVFVDADVRGLSIVGNVIEGTGQPVTSGPAIRVDNGDGSPGRYTVSGNNISGHGIGIHIKGTNASVTGNTIEECRLEGILSTASNVKICSNSITNINRGTGTPNRSAIVIESGSKVSVTENVCVDTAGSPIHFSVIRVSSGDDITVANNEGFGFTDVGVYVDAVCSKIKVYDNHMAGGGSNSYFLESGGLGTVVSVCHGNTSDRPNSFSINSNATNIRAEEFVTLSNGTASQLDTINSISISAGRTLTLRFASISTITHNVGNIKTRNSANITTSVGSTFQAVSDGTHWTVLN